MIRGILIVVLVACVALVRPAPAAAQSPSPRFTVEAVLVFVDGDAVRYAFRGHDFRDAQTRAWWTTAADGSADAGTPTAAIAAAKGTMFGRPAPDVALRSGGGIVVWEEQPVVREDCDGAQRVPRGQVKFSRLLSPRLDADLIPERSPAWTPEGLVAEGDEDTVFLHPSVALDVTGAGVAVWREIVIHRDEDGCIDATRSRTRYRVWDGTAWIGDAKGTVIPDSEQAHEVTPSTAPGFATDVTFTATVPGQQARDTRQQAVAVWTDLQRAEEQTCNGNTFRVREYWPRSSVFNGTSFEPAQTLDGNPQGGPFQTVIPFAQDRIAVSGERTQGADLAFHTVRVDDICTSPGEEEVWTGRWATPRADPEPAKLTKGHAPDLTATVADQATLVYGGSVAARTEAAPGAYGAATPIATGEAGKTTVAALPLRRSVAVWVGDGGTLTWSEEDPATGRSAPAALLGGSNPELASCFTVQEVQVEPVALEPDADGDNLRDRDETDGPKTDPCDPDTDTDGLLDPWEVDPATGAGGLGIAGAGFDLDRDRRPEASRDAVFGPYGSYDGPDPLHKDVFLEVDWQDCTVQIPGTGKTGCPEWFLPNFLFGPADPMHHRPDPDGLQDVVELFDRAPVKNPDGRGGVNLNIQVDEAIEHAPNCDQGTSHMRSSRFGRAAQRGNAAVIRAKEKAFRYVWSGHSSSKDRVAAGPDPCATPTIGDLEQMGLGTQPLPDYDHTPFGWANDRGRDVLVTLGPLWICPSNRGNALYARLCFRWTGVVNTANGPLTVIKPGIFPAQVPVGAGLKLFTSPISLLLGVGEAQGIRQLWGRALTHLLGHALGVPTADIGNDPAVPGFAGPAPYTGWDGLKDLRWAPRDDGTAPAHAEELPAAANDRLALVDGDGDAVAEGADVCPGVSDTQADLDGDGAGDACDPDPDGDGREGPADLQPFDTDDDGSPNASDGDDDGDGVEDGGDNCRLAPNPGQANHDGDAAGDVCDDDGDGDGAPTILELVGGSDPFDAARRPEFVGAGASCTDGADNDADGQVDGADSGCADADGDTAPDLVDTCPTVADPGMYDEDGDGIGDACDDDSVPPPPPPPPGGGGPSGSGGSAGGGAGAVTAGPAAGAAASTPPVRRVTSAQLRAGLATALGTTTRSLRRLGLRRLLRAGGFTVGGFTALAPGTLTVSTTLAGRAQPAAATVLARGSRRFTRAGRARVAVRLTRRGRALLRRRRRAALTVTLRFAPRPGAAVRRSATVTLRR